MSLKDLFAGGQPGGTYGEGIRQRGKSIAIIWGLSLVSLIVTYGAFALFSSVWATLGVATLCGLVSSRADIGFDPPAGDAPNKSDKLRWIILFVHALAALAAVAIYTALDARDGFDVFRSGLVAWLFGGVLGYTEWIMRSAVSRAHA